MNFSVKKKKIEKRQKNSNSNFAAIEVNWKAFKTNECLPSKNNYTRYRCEILFDFSKNCIPNENKNALKPMNFWTSELVIEEENAREITAQKSTEIK